MLGILVAADEHFDVRFFLNFLLHPFRNFLFGDLFSHEHIGTALADVNLDEVSGGLR